jgi:hypothetical protein
LNTVQAKADELRREAQQLLYELLTHDPNKSIGREVDRFVECVIGAAMMEIVAMQSIPVSTTE